MNQPSSDQGSTPSLTLEQLLNELPGLTSKERSAIKQVARKETGVKRESRKVILYELLDECQSCGSLIISYPRKPVLLQDTFIQYSDGEEILRSTSQIDLGLSDLVDYCQQLGRGLVLDTRTKVHSIPCCGSCFRSLSLQSRIKDQGLTTKDQVPTTKEQQS